MGWYYTWGTKTEPGATIEFVPMVFSPKHIDEIDHAPVVLGFNDPDHPKQANVTVERAIEAWPQPHSLGLLTDGAAGPLR